EELTRERFVPDSFSPGGTGRLYRTGDLGRYGLGDVEYVGRRDRQLKVRGFRIEPAEVESALRRHPDLAQAVVRAGEDRQGDQRLVAYVVPANGHVPEGEELRRFLAERLPDYMIPARFVALGALPLTPNGKLDERSLPSPEWNG